MLHKNRFGFVAVCYFILSFITLLGCSGNGSGLITDGQETSVLWDVTVPVAGNSWVVGNTSETESLISNAGMVNWSSAESRIRTHFFMESTGEITLGLRARVNSGEAVIRVTVGEASREVTVSNHYFESISLGRFALQQPGYHWVELQGVQKTGERFPDVKDILLSGVADTSTVTFVRDDFYWGRRGPSVHLNYEVPPQAGDVQWFYNEITVPEGEDVLGSYFMANGFAEGYFGMQVNGPTERRVLFSVWSPYQTDNPNEIPDDYKIILLGKGESVNTGEFGNEGSGGQSYLKFMWQAGNTYRFLLKGEPAENQSTDYTAYFLAPESGQWQLIASFRRPHTSTYLKRPHSFLENFWTTTGDRSRRGLYGNQWICDTASQWHELTQARFTADATARKGARLDYLGGVDGGRFFLQNCGFFSDGLPIDSVLMREATGSAPEIDFETLPAE